jgi:hypothetical protein
VCIVIFVVECRDYGRQYIYKGKEWRARLIVLSFMKMNLESISMI